jgi:hypothetical protein
MKGKQIMKNQNIICIAVVLALAFALAPVTNAAPNPGGIPTSSALTNLQSSPEGENLPVISIHSTGNVLRGKIGSFVLAMKTPLPSLAPSAMYVNFKVSGTAIPGADYVAFASPAHIGPSGYATILVKTLPDPRGAFSNQAYSVVVTLEPGAGYSLGSSATSAARSATIWIKPSTAPSDW